MQVLVEQGARLDLLDTSGGSAFHHACIQDESKALRTLLSVSPLKSLIVMVKDHNSSTALIQALCHDSIGCAMTLLKLDDVWDIVGHDGWTAAHHAAKLGDRTGLEAVLRHPTFVKGSKAIDVKPPSCGHGGRKLVWRSEESAAGTQLSHVRSFKAKGKM